MGAAVLAAGWISGWQRSITACFDSPSVDRLQSTTSDHGGAMIGVAFDAVAILFRGVVGRWIVGGLMRPDQGVSWVKM